MEKLKVEGISFAQTFVALFLTVLGNAITQLPLDQVWSGHVFTVASIVGLISAAARTALKAAWQKVMPVPLGGKAKV